jgi:hypothetical protein
MLHCELKPVTTFRQFQLLSQASAYASVPFLGKGQITTFIRLRKYNLIFYGNQHGNTSSTNNAYLLTADRHYASFGVKCMTGVHLNGTSQLKRVRIAIQGC